MTPRPFGSYKFYRRAPGRKLFKGAAAGAPAQACVDVGSSLVLYRTDNAPSAFRVDINTILYACCGVYAGVHYADIWRSTDNGATWTRTCHVRDPVRTGEMLNGGVIMLGASLFYFTVYSSGGQMRLMWFTSADLGATWTGWDAAHQVLNVNMSYGNSAYWVTPWFGGQAGQDQKATGAVTQEILVALARKTTPIIQFKKCTWNGTTWALQYTASTGALAQPAKITALTDEDNIYAGIASENTSPWCYFVTLPKGNINGGTPTVTAWAGPPAGAGGGSDCSVPVLWSEGGNPKLQMHQGITTQNTLNWTSRKTVNQGGAWAADQTYPVLSCVAKKLGRNARAAASPAFGTLLDCAFAEYVNAYAWFERA